MWTMLTLRPTFEPSGGYEGFSLSGAIDIHVPVRKWEAKELLRNEIPKYWHNDRHNISLNDKWRFHWCIVLVIYSTGPIH